jgi:hypothetical protein
LPKRLEVKTYAMNNLTVGLAVLGGLVLAGVVAHSAWQARRRTPHVVHADRVEPVADPSVEPRFDDEDASTVRVSLGQGMHLPTPAVIKPLQMDPLIDAMASIEVDTPVSGDAALAAMPPTRRVGSKPFAIEGRNAASGDWESPKAGSTYNRFQAGVQLANRTGALNDIEFSEFVQKAQSFADAVDGELNLPEMRDEVSRARELDAFASSHDAQLGFMIRARGVAWSPGYVQQQALKAGFVPGATAGRLVLSASEAGMPPVIVLSFDTQAALADDPEQSALREIELSLDAPQVLRSEQPFVRLREAAIQLSASMDGLITDTQGAIITRDAMDVISADLEQLYDTLDERDLSAGSAQARRLFS